MSGNPPFSKEEIIDAVNRFETSINRIRFDKYTNQFIGTEKEEIESQFKKSCASLINSSNIESIYQQCPVCYEMTRGKTKCNHPLCYECWNGLSRKPTCINCKYCNGNACDDSESCEKKVVLCVELVVLNIVIQMMNKKHKKHKN